MSTRADGWCTHREDKACARVQGPRRSTPVVFQGTAWGGEGGLTREKAQGEGAGGEREAAVCTPLGGLCTHRAVRGGKSQQSPRRSKLILCQVTLEGFEVWGGGALFERRAGRRVDARRRGDRRLTLWDTQPRRVFSILNVRRRSGIG
jgi:hypothetical protein